MPTEILYNQMQVPHFCSLLDSAITRFISGIMEQDALLSTVLILVVLIALIVSAIYLYLFFKKKRFAYTARIRKHVENLVSEIITNETAEGYEVPARFHGILNNRVARQFAIDELVRCRKNFSGTLAEGIVNLYIQLGLKQFSLKKLSRNSKWHIKARGIQELYMMDQADLLTTIYKNTNNRNEFIRMEAQIGVIHLTGFPGLRFLDVISYPLTEWQQLKLLEQLRLFPKKEGLAEKIPGWLQSKNDTVVRFALKLADEYQQFSTRGAVTFCLAHRDTEVRRQAIRTLIRLGDENIASVLCGYFSKEPVANQVTILEGLTGIATDQHAGFLTQQLDHPDDTVKMKVALVLAGCCTGGLQHIENRALIQPEPYERIYNYVKTMQ